MGADSAGLLGTEERTAGVREPEFGRLRAELARRNARVEYLEREVGSMPDTIKWRWRGWGTMKDPLGLLLWSICVLGGAWRMQYYGGLQGPIFFVRLYLELGSLVKPDRLPTQNFLYCNGNQTFDISILSKTSFCTAKCR